MDGIKMLKERRSIRTFIKKDIPEEIINEIIDCGRFAPTANNIQPWIFIVVKDKKLKDNIAKITGGNGKFISESGVCVAIFCEEVKYYLEDGVAATENILLAATYYGLGSCWVAGDKKPYVEEVRKLLEVPQNYKLISLVAIGYTEKDVVEKAQNINKKTLKEVMFIDKYKKL
jgi:nitroreductase